MKKIDEIMELLTEEIDGFNRSISKLEDLSENLQNVKIKADTSNIRFQLKEFLRLQERTMYGHKVEVEEINKAVKRAKLTPKWLLALFCVTFALTVLTTGYFGYHFIQFEENKKEAFMQGKKEAILELRDYFDDHPIIYEDFKKWARRQDSLSNKK